MSDLYELCPRCGGTRCLSCMPRGVVLAGITRDDVTRMQDHLDRGAPMMLALRAEVTRLEGLLKEANDEIERLEDQNEARSDR